MNCTDPKHGHSLSRRMLVCFFGTLFSALAGLMFCLDMLWKIGAAILTTSSLPTMFPWVHLVAAIALLRIADEFSTIGTRDAVARGLLKKE